MIRSLPLLATLLSLLSASCNEARNQDIKEPLSAGSIAGASVSAACPLSELCTEGLPVLPLPTAFSSAHNKGLARTGNPLHQARDVVALEGKPIWIIGKFAYSYIDANLVNEKVDIYLSEGCSSAWRKLGQVKTSKAKQHAAVDGVVDDGGRVLVELSKLGVPSLPVGRHRLTLVVPADNSFAELFVDVVSPSTAFIVVDLDGTLMAEEWAGATKAHSELPEAFPGAAENLSTFYNKGYHIEYLTARAEWFTSRTREWLKANKFPPGIVRTKASVLGAKGAAAAQFKAAELGRLKAATGIVPSFAFGNKESDVKAFGAAGISPTSSYYYKFEGDAMGGTSHEDYQLLAKRFNTLPSACPL